MIVPLLVFLRSPLAKYGAVALAFVLAIWSVHHLGYRAGVKAKEAEHAKALEKAEKKAAETKKQSDAITQGMRADLASANAKIASLSTKLKSEIPRYVTPKADRACVVPSGYVLLRNAAGSGSAAVPPAAGQSLDADSGLALSAIAENDIENGRSFQAAIAEIEAWRAWYVQQAELWEKEYGAKP